MNHQDSHKATYSSTLTNQEFAFFASLFTLYKPLLLLAKFKSIFIKDLVNLQVTDYLF